MPSALAETIPDDVRDLYLDVAWRIDNLYTIADDQGRIVPFKPNVIQRHLFDNLHQRNIVLKARQLGCTTFIQILMLDQCLFRPGTQVGMVAHRLDDAKRIFREKAIAIYERLPDWLKALVPLEKATATEAVFANGSSFTVGTSLRGGTFQMLHISEHGKVCASFPDKAREIRTGTLNTAPPEAFVFIESTAEGQHGDFYDLCEQARMLKRQTVSLSSLQYRFHFFPWFLESRYVVPDDVATTTPISEPMERYFEMLEDRHGIELTIGQKAWYVMTAATQHEDMKREHPSFPDEAFEAVVEGAIYGQFIEQASQDGRIGRKPPIQGLPVFSCWDIGISDHTAIWLFQILRGGVRRYIASYANNNAPVSHYANWLQAKGVEMGITYRAHILPHDGKSRDKVSGESYENALKRLTGIEVTCMPATDPLLGINEIRNLFPLIEIDDVECADGLRALKAYQWEMDEKAGMAKRKPKHNWASHRADALRTSAFFRESMIGQGTRVMGGF